MSPMHSSYQNHASHFANVSLASAHAIVNDLHARARKLAPRFATASLYPAESDWYPDSPADVYTEVECGAGVYAPDGDLAYTVCSHGHERLEYGSARQQAAERHGGHGRARRLLGPPHRRSPGRRGDLGAGGPMTARYKVEQDLSYGWTDSTRRYIIVDTTTNRIEDEGFTNQKEARSWAAHLNREDRTAMKTATCRHCHQPIEREPNVGWVLVEEGGTYDVCEDSPSTTGYLEDSKHQPEKVSPV